MPKAIVGFSGFVGSNLLQCYTFDHFYNSKNFHEAQHKSFDELYFCGVPAIKWHANKYPQQDKDVLDNIKNILKTITVKKIILISTIDVYEDVDKEYNEDYDCDWVINHEYGRNRYMFEYFIKTHFDNYNIIRLPALFGKGLKKNIIYDLIHNNQISNIPINSSFQWYDLEWLKQDIDLIISNDIKICNLFTEPLDTLDIINMFDYSHKLFNHNDKKLIYNTKTKHDALFTASNGYIRNKSIVKNNIIQFIQFTKLDKTQLCVSNICVKNISHIQFACLLKLYGIPNVQIAPTTLISDWNNLNNLDLSVFTNQGLNVYSFQSITFTLNDLNIFTNTSNELLTHLKRVVDIASLNGIKILVFGCPRNRKINVDESDESNNYDNTFITFFNILGEYCVDKNIIICIEPNSKKYNCNYINTIEEAGKIVRNINHSNIKMMVDIGNAIMENDNLQHIHAFADIIYNIDVAHENMADLSNPSPYHITFKTILNEIKYTKKINLEMIITPLRSEHVKLCKNDELDILTKSLQNFITLYADIPNT